MFARLLAVPDRLATAYARRPVPWRIAFAVALLLVLAFTCARYAEKAVTPSRDGTLTRTALLRWRPQIQSLEAGDNIYHKHNYPNPPIMAMILWPFTELPPVAGGLLWLLLKAGMAWLMAVWTFRLCGPLSGPAKMLAVILAAHPVLGDLNHGNVNIFIAFLVLACLELFRRGWDLAAGLTLGLAIACKVTPALFLPYFGWKAVRAFFLASRPCEGSGTVPAPSQGRLAKRSGAFWRAGGKLLLGTGVGLGLFLFAVPSVVLAARSPGGVTANLRAGWGENLTLLESWFDGMVKPFLIDGRITSVHANQSIPGVVNRLLTHEPSEVDYDEDSGRELPKEYHNLADIGAVGARWVVRGCQAIFVLLMVLLCRTDAGGTRSGLAVAAECGLIVLGMLLFSERTWKHHGTGLILPVAAIIGLWCAPPTGLRTKWFLAAVLYAVTLLTLVPGLFGGRAQDLALTYGTHTTAFLLLTVAVVVVLWQTRDDRPRPAVSA